MMAVPSILIVAPSGTEKPATLLLTPNRFSMVRKVMGNVAPDDAVEKAKAQTLRIFCNRMTGLRPVKTFSKTEYTKRPWSRSTLNKVKK